MGKYLLEGIKPLADAVSLGISVETILVREGSSFTLEKVTPEIVLELGAQLFDSIADTEHSQGVIAAVSYTHLMVFSASYYYSISQDGTAYSYLRRQIVWVIAGFCAMVFGAAFDYKRYRKFAIPLLSLIHI